MGEERHREPLRENLDIEDIYRSICFDAQPLVPFSTMYLLPRVKERPDDSGQEW